MNLGKTTKAILLTSFLIIGLPQETGLAQESQPNIIMILSDDHGWGDLECYGAKDLSTPVLDEMALEGIQFMDSYVTAPQCTPSRCGLITGVYQQRIGLEANPDMKYYPTFGFQDGLTTTFAELLQKAGYRTGDGWQMAYRGDPGLPAFQQRIRVLPLYAGRNGLLLAG